MAQDKNLTDAPLLPALPVGKPVLRFILKALPSYNDILYLTPQLRAEIMRDERIRGRGEGAELLARLKIPSSVIMIGRGRGRVSCLRAKEIVHTSPLFCYVEVKRKPSKSDKKSADRRRDVYNVAAKSFVDGLTDAGLWVDDSEEYHRDYWVHYAGLATITTLDVRFYYAP